MHVRSPRWPHPWQRPVLGLVLLATAVTKVLPGGLGPRLDQVGATAAEALIGVLLLFGGSRVGLWVAVGFELLLAAMLFYEVLTGETASCGCLGPLPAPIWLRIAIIYGGALLALSGLLESLTEISSLSHDADMGRLSSRL